MQTNIIIQELHGLRRKSRTDYNRDLLSQATHRLQELSDKLDHNEQMHTELYSKCAAKDDEIEQLQETINARNDRLVKQNSEIERLRRICDDLVGRYNVAQGQIDALERQVMPAEKYNLLRPRGPVHVAPDRPQPVNDQAGQQEPR